MTENYIYVIIALLPLAASMLVLQVNPYHALVIRGILGAVSALVYAVLGAADVALTEALVGTLLSITLYAVAVRSSLVMRLGVLKDSLIEAEDDLPFGELVNDLRVILGRRHLRLELVPYLDTQTLEQALMTREVHATCLRQPDLSGQDAAFSRPNKQPYQTVARVQRLYDIMQAELLSPVTSLVYVNAPEVSTPKVGTQNPGKVAS